MLIKDLDKMERLVRRQKNLVWDDKSPNGYDVIQLVRHPNPAGHVDGRFIKGKWYRTVRIPLTRDGWELPNVHRKA
jgi:hypothetical protein